MLNTHPFIHTLIKSIPLIIRRYRFITLIWVGLIATVFATSFVPVWAQMPDASAPLTLREKILAMEQGLEQEFEEHFGRNLADVTQGPDDIAATLADIGQETGTAPAVLWVMPRVDHLHLVLITPNGTPIVRDLFDVPKQTLVDTVQTFQQNLKLVRSNQYLDSAQQLYEWIITPVEAEFLQPEGVDTLLLCLGDGVRGLAISALHDGQHFLIENYSLTRIPAFNLIQTNYSAIQPGRVLAMGASEFENHSDLPAVPVELSRVLWELQTATASDEDWVGQSFLNQEFILPKLTDLLSAQPFDIVHLATHADFRPGLPEESYIQFWDQQLTLDQMSQMGLNMSTVELIVLSACNTALGDSKAELGFAGMALQSGIKSALASLWYVSDAGTLALMSEFYRQLPLASTKAEALRQAQIRMLSGEVRLEGDILLVSRGPIELPDTLASSASFDFSHPLYWSGFTMISSPW